MRRIDRSPGVLRSWSEYVTVVGDVDEPRLLSLVTEGTRAQLIRCEDTSSEADGRSSSRSCGCGEGERDPGLRRGRYQSPWGATAEASSCHLPAARMRRAAITAGECWRAPEIARRLGQQTVPGAVAEPVTEHHQYLLLRTTGSRLRTGCGHAAAWRSPPRDARWGIWPRAERGRPARCRLGGAPACCSAVPALLLSADGAGSSSHHGLRWLTTVAGMPRRALRGQKRAGNTVPCPDAACGSRCPPAGRSCPGRAQRAGGGAAVAHGSGHVCRPRPLSTARNSTRLAVGSHDSQHDHPRDSVPGRVGGGFGHCQGDLTGSVLAQPDPSGQPGEKPPARGRPAGNRVKGVERLTRHGAPERRPGGSTLATRRYGRHRCSGQLASSWRERCRRSGWALGPSAALS